MARTFKATFDDWTKNVDPVFAATAWSEAD